MTNKILTYLKQNRMPVPISVGLLLAHIPFSRRPGIGKLYHKQSMLIKEFSRFSEKEKAIFIYQNFHRIFSHAYTNVKFYRELYIKNDVTPDNIKNFADIAKVPIVTKQQLLDCPLEDRSFPVKNRLLSNTGGSSGKSLYFYMDPLRFGNEWAHVHAMWNTYGYKTSDLKMSFDGRVKINNDIIYDFARNSLLYDIYADFNEISESLIKLLNKHPVKYLHGYPSAIYEFAVSCKHNPELLAILRRSLKAAFLSSEFPSPLYRNTIEEVFGIPTQSFYGHTETCVLAVEKDPFVYEPYQTYGFAEATKIDSAVHLIGTSYFNYASPLIRYDTADQIEPKKWSNEGILEKFAIKEGRSGEFIIDKEGKKVPLTGLIFGRHHELFNSIDHIQIYQKDAGVAVILYVSPMPIPPLLAAKRFDSQLINMDFEFKQISAAIKTASGKINLLVKEMP